MTRRLFAAVVAAFAVSPAFADDSTLKVKVGDKFPDFTLTPTKPDGAKAEAKAVSLADLKGKVAVIAFYPKALTGG